MDLCGCCASLQSKQRNFTHCATITLHLSCHFSHPKWNPRSSYRTAFISITRSILYGGFNASYLHGNSYSTQQSIKKTSHFADTLCVRSRFHMHSVSAACMYGIVGVLQFLIKTLSDFWIMTIAGSLRGSTDQAEQELPSVGRNITSEAAILNYQGWR